nr:retrovirus-related Pol polyprotein from transposon TNT 1-94 [Tanacetum cinerariifolium]
MFDQAKYALEILHKHGMEKSQSIGTPMATKPKLNADLSGNPVDQTEYRSKIESLIYLTSSRPDIVQAIYADHAGCIDTHKSTSGGIQFLGDKLVSWMSKKQNCTAMSSIKAEYVALSASCTIAISCNLVQHSRTKHIHTRYHFIKEQVENGQFCDSDLEVVFRQHTCFIRSLDEQNGVVERRNRTLIEAARTIEVEEIETLNLELDHKVTKLDVENEHLKQTYKQLFDSIKSSRVHSKEQSLKEQLNKLKGKAVLTEAVSLNPINPALLQVDVTPLVPKLRKNRTAHSDYIRHTQEEAATLREIVESKRLLSPLNTSLDYACKYTRRIQELLMILQQTCPCIIDLGTKLVAVTPKNKTKQIRHTAQITKSERTTVATSPSPNIDSNTHVLSSTGVTLVSSASGSMSQDNTKKNRIRRTQKKAKKTELEDHLRTVKSSLNKASVVDSKSTFSVIKSVSNMNSNLKCASLGNVCPLTRIATATIVPPREPIPIVNSTDKPVVTLVVQIVLWYLDSGCSKHMTRDRSQLINFVQKFLGTVKFGNDHVAKIMGYGDYQIRSVIIFRVYYVEGLRHNLFSVGQFCDSDLEVAFRQHTCFICNLDGVDLLTGSRGNNLYTLSLQDTLASSPICLLSKASKTKSWLWHRRLSHLNFVCAMGKSTKKTHKPKSEDTHQEKLYLLHMDLYEPMRVESVNGKKYILVIVDDYSRFTWVKFLRSKDETPMFIIKFLKMIQVRLNVPVRRIRIDNGTEFVNQTLWDYYKEVGISHETSVARSPQQNGVVERPDIGIFIGYAPSKKAFRIYNRRTRRIVETIHVDFDELAAMASEQCSSGPALNEMTSGTITHMGNDPLLGVPIPEVTFEQSSSTASPQSNVQSNHPMTHHNSKWTKDHPLNYIIGPLSRPVSTRLQLHEQALFCYYDAFLTSVEPKTYKEALTQTCWIEAMQEELNEFERLE